MGINAKKSSRVFICLAITFCFSIPLLGLADNGSAKKPDTGLTRQENPVSVAIDEIESLRREMKENPAAPSAIRLGELLLDKGEPEEALKCFDEALNMNPRSHEAKIGRGIAFGRLGDYEKAEQALRDALALNPNPARVHYELGLIREKRGDFSGAVSEYKEGLKRYREGMK